MSRDKVISLALKDSFEKRKEREGERDGLAKT